MTSSFSFTNYRFAVTLKHTKQSRKHSSETYKLFCRINSHLRTLSNKFPGISIPMVHKNDDYGYIFYTKENQRGPILCYIRHKIDNQFNCRSNNKILDKAHYLDKVCQFRAWSKNSDYMKRLESFLKKFDYAKDKIIY